MGGCGAGVALKGGYLGGKGMVFAERRDIFGVFSAYFGVPRWIFHAVNDSVNYPLVSLERT